MTDFDHSFDRRVVKRVVELEKHKLYFNLLSLVKAKTVPDRL